MGEINTSDFKDHKLTDTILIKRILTGENELYEILLRRNNQKLYRVIRSYIKDEAEVEDIMQNTYLKAYEKLHQFNHFSTYSTWLIKIGINESLARLKEKGKVLDLDGNFRDVKSNNILELPDAHQPTPENEVIKKESRQLVEKIIDSLEPKYKAVYILKEVEGMSVKEISECLDISVSNVKVRLHRAKGMLREKLLQITANRDIFEFGFNRCDRVTENVMKAIY